MNRTEDNTGDVPDQQFQDPVSDTRPSGAAPPTLPAQTPTASTTVGVWDVVSAAGAGNEC